MQSEDVASTQSIGGRERCAVIAREAPVLSKSPRQDTAKSNPTKRQAPAGVYNIKYRWFSDEDLFKVSAQNATAQCVGGRRTPLKKIHRIAGSLVSTARIDS